MKKFQFLGVLASLLFAASANADVFGPGAGYSIPDNTAAGAESQININTGGGTITSVNSVTIEVSTLHTWVGDLVITLTAPNGDNVHLMRRLGATSGTSAGSSGDWLVGTHVFVEGTGANLPATGNVAPGTWNRTSTSLQVTPAFDPDDFTVFNGDLIDGNWTLNIADRAAGDVGAIAGWSIDISYTAIPEPGSAIALLGLAGLGLVRRRR